MGDCGFELGFEAVDSTMVSMGRNPNMLAQSDHGENVLGCVPAGDAALPGRQAEQMGPASNLFPWHDLTSAVFSAAMERLPPGARGPGFRSC